MSLSCAAGSAGEARVLLRGFLEDVDRESWRDAAELAISEIVTNGWLHARTRMEVRLIAYADRAFIEVRDFSVDMPAERPANIDALAGRGMAIVCAVSLACGVHSLGEHGKVVWFCVGDEIDRADDTPLVEWDLNTWDESKG